MRGISFLFSLTALIMAIGYLWRVMFGHIFNPGMPEYYLWLNPITFLMSLVLSIRQTIQLQPARTRGITGSVRAFIHPQTRPAYFMRNFSLAISIGLIQGFVSGYPSLFAHSILAIPIIINISLLLMITAIVYASFDFTYRQPSLVVRLAGLSLVTFLAVLGVIGIYLVESTTGWLVQQNNIVANDTERKPSEMAIGKASRQK